MLLQKPMLEISGHIIQTGSAEAGLVLKWQTMHLLYLTCMRIVLLQAEYVGAAGET